MHQEQILLGASIRWLVEERDYASVADDGFKTASVVVSFTDDDALKNGCKFAAAGLQIAAGVPLQCGQGPEELSQWAVRSRQDTKYNSLGRKFCHGT